MNARRIPFADLPARVRAAVAARVGDEYTAKDVELGESAAVAALLETDTGPVFVKGLPDGHRGARKLDVERRLGPHLPDFAPRLLWSITEDGWTLLGFEGLHVTPWAHFPAGSTHLEPCAAVLRELGGVKAPAQVRLPPLWARWESYDQQRAEELLTGDHLVHGDPSCGNFLIDADHHAHLVDWAWAARGPAWATAALWGARLMLDGRQTAEQAAAYARNVPAFAAAPREAVAFLTRAEADWCQYWQHHTGGYEDRLETARAWADHWNR
ncbi:aminoglycoside phosphotransferase [Streptomyces sp. NPDC097619]|uniref:phosphotransferase family protein n=1 Tax=Streptomyces sp. NPDC097619 TaxID=3157228 RepID=UPI0033248012